jgi:hypothetical protein
MIINVKVASKDTIFKISSFCSVATKEVKREVLFLICCIQRLYGEIPVIIYSDTETKTYLDSQRFSHVSVFVREPVLNLKIKNTNGYHKPDVIALKMDVLEAAIRLHKNSLFLDSDIILLEPLQGPNDCQVALSHNLTECKDVGKQSVLDGMFNAGMIWANTTRFTKWWREEYISGHSTFFEQSILNHAPNIFRTGYFDLKHNYGFWRGLPKNRLVGSFHCHLDKELDSKFVPYMVDRVDPLRKEIIKRLRLEYETLYFQYERIFT